MIFRCIYKTKTGLKNNLPYGGAMLISPPAKFYRKPSVGADAYIGPPYRTPCNASVGVGLPDDPPGLVPHPL